MKCWKERELAFHSESTYIPTCNDENTDYYDGCQCSGFGIPCGTLIPVPTGCACVDIW